MRYRNKTRPLVVATAAIGLALFDGTAAHAAAPTVTVTPSEGLTDGAVVAVSAAGFAANEVVYVTECAIINTVAACAADDPGKWVTTDASGTAITSFTVRKVFAAYTVDGQAVGTVDCGTVAGGCVVAASAPPFTTSATAPISFS